MKTNIGNDFQAKAMGGGTLGATGSATSPTATGFTTTGLVSGAHVGCLVVLGGVWGVITANTTTAVTVDRWYTPGSPGGAAAATPSAGTFVILTGQAPAIFMGITADSASPAAGDTTLTGEITTSGGGLVRKIITYAHTTGAASYTGTAVFTANGTDSLPVTIAKMAMFGGLGAAVQMVFESLLNAVATLSASGDQLTVTHTVTT